jgi:hypothetical protein
MKLLFCVILAAIVFDDDCFAKGGRGRGRGHSSGGYRSSFRSFGSPGVSPNTFVYKDDYIKPGVHGSSRFLTNDMFNLVRPSHWSYMKRFDDNRSSWDVLKDHRWRITTKSPYFENKIPGEERFLPASAVVGEIQKLKCLNNLKIKF